MIKINFVKEREKRKFVLRIDWLKIYFLSACLCLFLVIFSFLAIQREINDKNREKELLQRERARYIILIKKIEKLKKEDDELKNRIQTIIDLKRKRGQLLKIFDEIMLSVPIGKMYLVNFSLHNNRAIVSGFALDYENVAVYLKALESKKLFKRTDLLYTKQKEIKGYNLIEFKINLEF
ncbi:PilN domain-containing protein [Thermosulfurimonas sp. F29]|uniref:PilN domain-containing protein n=1 Tax=Thermosulfurimonas sp. F29 TaxID=2867247 RepID=UPI001C83216E|nr:PilN domain-containing protein [Thermosulfurimonas sp. F29]MBX6423656.1 PilN domain-containing protein [Thermosulfurimonas sp. F29]